MTKIELLDHKGDAIYLPMRIPGQTEKKLVRMTESSLDVFSYEKFPKILSTRAAKLKFDDVYRFFFDYDEDLSGIPFIKCYNDEDYGDYTLEFKICKIIDGKAIIEGMGVQPGNIGYRDDMGDTAHFKVAPTKILVTHRREQLISFSYTKNPLIFNSTIEYTPVRNEVLIFSKNLNIYLYHSVQDE